VSLQSRSSKNIDRIIPDPIKINKISHFHNLHSDLFCLWWLFKYKSKGDNMLTVAALSEMAIVKRITITSRAPLAIDCHVVTLFVWLANYSMKDMFIHATDMRL